METERDFGAELDALRKELGEIKMRIAALTLSGGPGEKAFEEKISCEEPEKAPAENKQEEEEKPALEKYASEHIRRMNRMHPDPILQAAMKELEDDCIASKDMGRVTYLGVFASGERQSNWVRKSVPAGGLLRLIETREAEKVLACIGSSDRLNLLLALLKKPMTVNQLVEECGCRSTGQVYHHLKPLLAADLVEEDTKEERKGYYAVRPHRVQGIIMLLAGVSDMLDPAYARGSWDSREDG